jgi:hypothetical protein
MRLAELLPTCGHSFCAPCIASFAVSECPLCRVPFKPGSAVPNWSLREDAASLTMPASGRGLEAQPDESGTPETTSVSSSAPMPPPAAAAISPPAPQTAEQLLSDLQLAQRLAAGVDLAAAEARRDQQRQQQQEQQEEEEVPPPSPPPPPPPPPPAVDTAEALLACRRIVGSPAFVAQVKLFVDAHCGVFDLEAEENKLEYTELHEKYVALVDAELSQALQEELGAGFDMVAFLAAVPAFVESLKAQASADGGGTAAAAVVDVTDDDDGFTPAAVPETLEVLSRFTSFEAFKASMLAAKQAKRREAEVMAAAAAKYFDAFAPSKPSTKSTKTKA